MATCLPGGSTDARCARYDRPDHFRPRPCAPSPGGDGRGTLRRCARTARHPAGDAAGRSDDRADAGLHLPRARTGAASARAFSRRDRPEAGRPCSDRSLRRMADDARRVRCGGRAIRRDPGEPSADARRRGRPPAGVGAHRAAGGCTVRARGLRRGTPGAHPRGQQLRPAAARGRPDGRSADGRARYTRPRSRQSTRDQYPGAGAARIGRGRRGRTGRGGAPESRHAAIADGAGPGGDRWRARGGGDRPARTARRRQSAVDRRPSCAGGHAAPIAGRGRVRRELCRSGGTPSGGGDPVDLVGGTGGEGRRARGGAGDPRSRRGRAGIGRGARPVARQQPLRTGPFRGSRSAVRPADPRNGRRPGAKLLAVSRSREAVRGGPRARHAAGGGGPGRWRYLALYRDRAADPGRSALGMAGRRRAIRAHFRHFRDRAASARTARGAGRAARVPTPAHRAIGTRRYADGQYPVPQSPPRDRRTGASSAWMCA